MRLYQIAPLDRFDFSQPDDWPNLIQRLEWFHEAFSLKVQEQKSQIHMLIYMYTMGDEANDILSSLALAEAEKEGKGTDSSIFEAHFLKQKNLTSEQSRFNQNKQEEGYSVNSFITALYCLFQYCMYSALHDELVMGRYCDTTTLYMT